MKISFPHCGFKVQNNLLGVLSALIRVEQACDYTLCLVSYVVECGIVCIVVMARFMICEFIATVKCRWLMVTARGSRRPPY